MGTYVNTLRRWERRANESQREKR
ncbi:hypothetical protein, partial [Chromatium okenii]